MANEISSMTLATMPGPVKDNGQSAKPDATELSAVKGQTLPETGKDLPQQQDDKPANSAELREAVSQINNFVQSVKRDLNFSMDEASGRTVIKVLDSESGKLVRQIPSEEVLALASYLQGLQEDTPVRDSIPTGILFSDNT